jgi:hypothetical protein
MTEISYSSIFHCCLAIDICQILVLQQLISKLKTDDPQFEIKMIELQNITNIINCNYFNLVKYINNAVKRFNKTQELIHKMTEGYINIICKKWTIEKCSTTIVYLTKMLNDLEKNKNYNLEENYTHFKYEINIYYLTYINNQVWLLNNYMSRYIK